MDRKHGEVSEMELEKNRKATLVPTAGVKFEDQVKVLRAYAVLGAKRDDGAHYKEVMRVTRLARTQISGLNSFLVMLGLLSSPKRGQYKPTGAVTTFSSKSPGEEDFTMLREEISHSPLFRITEQFFLIHGSGPRGDFVSYLMEEAASKEPARADSAIEWLVRVDLLRQDEQGVLSLSTGGCMVEHRN